MPTREQSEKAYAEVEERRERYRGKIVIDHVAPDYHAKYPKACMSGWGRLTMNVTPQGKVLPCHAAETIPGLEFWNAREKPLADIWAHSPGFNAFRGFEWMQEPCRSCERKTEDFGGCRCQAMALLGDAAACDPICVEIAASRPDRRNRRARLRPKHRRLHAPPNRKVTREGQGLNTNFSLGA